MGLISNGTTIFDNGAMASGSGGSMVLISSATASNSASIEFTLGSYKEYKFYWFNCRPDLDNGRFQFQTSTDGGSTYATTITSTTFNAEQNEADSRQRLEYIIGTDLQQGTGFQIICDNVGNGTDESCSGILSLFNPSSTVFVKHFIARSATYHRANRIVDQFTAGYFNNTNDLTNIKFQFQGASIVYGKILMFGIN